MAVRLAQPQELQTAQLAGPGVSNRDIGQQFYLSHRTMGSHLYGWFPSSRDSHRCGDGVT